jgi:hypothetical protein
MMSRRIRLILSTESLNANISRLGRALRKDILKYVKTASPWFWSACEKLAEQQKQIIFED